MPKVGFDVRCRMGKRKYSYSSNGPQHFVALVWTRQLTNACIGHTYHGNGLVVSRFRSWHFFCLPLYSWYKCRHNMAPVAFTIAELGNPSFITLRYVPGHDWCPQTPQAWTWCIWSWFMGLVPCSFPTLMKTCWCKVGVDYFCNVILLQRHATLRYVLEYEKRGVFAAVE